MSTSKDLDRVRTAALQLHAAISDAAAKRGECTKSIKSLEATQKHAAESLKSSRNAFQTAVRKALADAHASVQSISAAVAAKRWAESTHARK